MNIKVTVTLLQLIGVALTLLVAVTSGSIANAFGHSFLDSMLLTLVYMIVGIVIYRAVSDVVLIVLRKEKARDR